jgi:hypothetical protein
VQRELVVAGRGLARDRQTGLDILRLAGLDRDRGDLLAGIGLGKADLEVFRRIAAQIDRRVAPAVVVHRHLVFERGRRGAAQRGKIGGELELGRNLLADRDGEP